MKLDQWRHRAAVTLAALAVLLSGCTTYVATHVTAFSDWSGSDATRTYAFTRTPEQENSLEQSTYEQLVANELSTYSFKRTSSASARYLVGLSYAIRSDIVTVADPLYYNPWPRPYWGPFDPWWGSYGPYQASYVNRSYPIYTHTLGIRITERATGKEVYNVTARNSGGESSLVRAMPYLVRSALADFPVGNGAVRTVRIPVGEKAGASNEVAVPAAPASGAAAKALQ